MANPGTPSQFSARTTKPASLAGGASGPAKVTSIADHRNARPDLFEPLRTPAPVARRQSKTALMVMGSAAAAPPLFWLLHGLLHLVHIL